MDKKITELLKELGLVNISKQEKELPDKELKARAGDAEIFYKNHFERKLNSLIQEQLENLAKEGDNISKVQLMRGSVIALLLIKEWFEKQKSLSMSRFDKEEESEPEESIGRLG